MREITLTNMARLGCVCYEVAKGLDGGASALYEGGLAS
jgi:hypothetical protein